MLRSEFQINLIEICIIICSDNRVLPPHDYKFSSIKTVIFLILYILNFILFFLWFIIYLLNSKGGFMIMTSFWLKSIFVCSVWHLLITPCNIDYALPQSLQSIYKGKQNFVLITVLRLPCENKIFIPGRKPIPLRPEPWYENPPPGQSFLSRIYVQRPNRLFQRLDLARMWGSGWFTYRNIFSNECINELKFLLPVYIILKFTRSYAFLFTY